MHVESAHGREARHGFVEANGTQLYYESHGDGDPVVLIMGMAADHHGWDAQIADLASTHRVIVFDNRGVGLSGKPDGPYSTDLLASDTVVLLDALGLDSIDLVGSSMGGAVAQLVALEHPERIRSLTLACTFATFDALQRRLMEHWVELVEQVGLRRALEGIFLWGFSRDYFLAHSEEIWDSLDDFATYGPTPESFVAQAYACLAHDTTRVLGDLRARTLVVVGADDRITTAASCADLARRLPNADVEVLPGGHTLMWEHPKPFTATLRRFLAQRAENG